MTFKRVDFDSPEIKKAIKEIKDTMSGKKLKKQVKLEVKHCRSCPFSEAEHLPYGQVMASCLAPAEIHKGPYTIDSYYKNYKSPEFCPLKNTNLLIVKK